MRKTSLRLLVVGVACLSVVSCSVKSAFNGYLDHARSQAGLVQKSVSVDGETIAYLEGGVGETLVLIHGFSGDKDNWTMMARHLKKRYHLIIPDLPPFGDSSKDVNRSYDVENQADRVHAFLKRLNTGPVCMAGHSLGGEVAGFFATKYPSEVKGLILVDCGGIDSHVESDVLAQAMKGKTPNPLIVGNRDDFDRVMKDNFEKPPCIPYPIKTFLVEQMVKNKPWNEKAFADIKAEPSGLEARLDRLTMPVLIIWGEQDRIINVSCVPVLEKNIKRHRTHILKQCGHSPEMEHPKETARVIGAFVDNFDR